MIKERTVQLIYQTVCCTLGLVGIIACFGVFDNRNMIRWDFYIHFTNLGNFLCIGVMLAELIQTAKKKQDSYVTAVPVLKFVGMTGAVMIFLVFNILLAGAADRDPQLNWRVGSLCFHIVLPLMYIADWFLFYERGKIKWFYPLISTVLPLAYIIFILIHAAVVKFDTSILIPGTQTPLIYPYFFINPEKLGLGGVAMWCVLLLIAFAVNGFVFWGIDKVGKKNMKS